MSAAAVATVEVNPKPTTVALCEHIKDNGHRCGTPAIRGRHFCYYHSRAHAPGPRIGQRDYRAPLLETIESLNLLIQQTNEALGSGRITDKIAGKLLYSVQLTTNLLKLAGSISSSNKKTDRTGKDSAGAPSSSSLPDEPVLGEVEGAGEESADNFVTEELTDQPVTEIPSAMEAVLAVTESQPEPQTLSFDAQYDDDPEMPQTVEEAQRALLTPKQVIDNWDTLRECDKLSPRHARLTRRMAIHQRAYSVLDRNNLIPDSYLNEFSLYPDKKR